MQYRKVQKNGDDISAIGYGLMRLPTRAGRIDEAKAEKQVLYALEKGVNYFDTALPYHNGESEKFLGRVIKKHDLEGKIKVATKLPPWQVRSRADMEQILDKQLESLQIKCIDYYLIHGIMSEQVWEDMLSYGVIEFLEEAKAAGKIKNIGFSFHSDIQTFKKIVDAYDWTFCQIQYNYLDITNQAGTEGLMYAAKRNIAVIVMEPLRGGNLVGKLPKSVQEEFNKASVRRTSADWALRWIWNHKEVTCILSGMNVDEHIKENIEIACTALPDSLSQDEIRIIEKARAEFETLTKVPCTGCAYCMPCPAGVNIPLCFTHYNGAAYFGKRDAKLMYIVQNYGIMDDKPSRASQCIECGKCESHCPQHIEIRAELKCVAKEMEAFYDPVIAWLAKRFMGSKQD